jgi:hypothetical protein
MKYTIPFLLLFAGLITSCANKPKIIEATEEQANGSPNAAIDNSNELHTVVANEVLHTSRYTYMNVTENGDAFWIAIPRKEVETGKTYYYRGGLKKNNFKSAEYDRVFETLYLISDVTEDPNGIPTMGGDPHVHSDEEPVLSNEKIAPPPGGITISELLKNKSQYEGKTVKVKGQVVKVNRMIMQRNWIHLRDGSTGEEVDLTITTTDNIQMGAIVAFEGIITLNKDFGAGYKYDIIMEEAKLLQ